MSTSLPPTLPSRRDFVAGMVHSSGPALGYFPIGASFGALAIQAGWSAAPTAAMSAGVYAAGSQFVGLDGLEHQSMLLIIFLMLLINLRHFPISLASAPLFNRFSLPHRLVLSAGLTDETFALDLTDQNHSVWYYHGIHTACWLSWMSGTLLGIHVGMLIPAQWVEFALPSLFIALTVDCLRTYPAKQIPTLILTGIILTTACWPAGVLAQPIAIVLVTAGYAVLTRATALPQHQRGQ